MKSRHAAAFALLGWYLMYPPMTPARKSINDAPLSQWKSGGGFDTAKECETVKARMRKSSKELSDTTPSWDQKGRDLADSIGDAQCVAADDPRLKGN
jgi:hypothetical protein